MLSESGKVDLFLKKNKSAQLPKKKKEKLKSKAAERKELLNHLKLLAKLEAEVNWKQNYGEKKGFFFLQHFYSNATKWENPSLGSQKTLNPKPNLLCDACQHF